MSDQFNSDSTQTAECPNATPPKVGHYGALWGTEDVNLTDTQLEALDMIVQGWPDIRISEMLSVDRKTLWRWKTQNADFRQRLDQTRRHVHTRVGDRYHDLLTRAWGVFDESLDHHSDVTRLRAAKSLLNMAGAFKRLEISEEMPRGEESRPEPIMDPKVG